jgi:hypothetical protein
MTCRRAISLLGLLIGAMPAPAASPRDELLRLVPGDVGFCLVLEDVRGHASQVLESPFAQQWQKSPMRTLVDKDRDWQNFTDSRRQIEQIIGIEWTKLRDDILGDALVFAYRPGPPGKPGEDRGLILLHARDPQALAKLIERVNKMQVGSRELKELEVREHNGQRYFHRAGATGANFYALIGPILAVSSQEGAVRDALDRLSEPGGYTESPIAAHLRTLLGPQRRLLSLWVNPRVFDAAIAAKINETPAEQTAVIRGLLKTWKALDGIAFGVSIEEHLELTLAARAQPSRLSPAARRFLTEAAKPSDLWRRFPDNAMLALAGRFDPAAFSEWLGEFLTQPAQSTLRDSLDRFVGSVLDKDVSKDVLPNLGPDFGLCVTAPENAEKGWVPQAVFALRVGPGDKPPFVDHAIFSAINSLAQLAVIDHNGKHEDRMVLKTDIREGQGIKYLVNAKRFPPGLSPAFRLRDGYLLLATSPHALRNFAAPRRNEESAEVPMLRVSLKELGRYIHTFRTPLAAALAEQNKAKPAELEQQLDGVAEILDGFDRLEVSQRPAEGQATLTIRLRTKHALRK